jgi:nucleoside-diphosphate kinase
VTVRRSPSPTQRARRPVDCPRRAPSGAWDRSDAVSEADGVRRATDRRSSVASRRRAWQIEQLELRTIDRATAEEHYAEHREKPFFGELVSFITSGPSVLARITGEDAIGCWRTMMGPTDPVDAPPGSIRGDLATVITENIVHGSDSPASAERELRLFFG